MRALGIFRMPELLDELRDKVIEKFLNDNFIEEGTCISVSMMESRVKNRVECIID